MRIVPGHVAAVLVLCALACATDRAPKSFAVQFGILRQEAGRPIRVEPTTEIPYVVGAENQVFGFLIEPSRKTLFRAQVIVFPPAAPESIGGLATGTPEKSPAEGIAGPELQWRGSGAIPMWLDPGDPKGDYRAVLRIDGKVASTVEFTVGP